MSTSTMNEVQTVMPYLMIQNAGQFLRFTQRVFNAEQTVLHTKPDGSIMHAEVKIGNSTIMFANSTPEWTPRPAGLFVYVDNADEVYHKALSEGATSLMEMADKDYGRTGGVRDPFGNDWWITSQPTN